MTNSGRILRVYKRESPERRTCEVVGDFYPYLYYASPDGRHRGLFGERLKMEVAPSPREIYTLRERLEQEGKKVYEADVLYVIRYCIDRVKDWSKTPLRVLYFDIEALDSLDAERAPEPVVSISALDSLSGKTYTFLLSDGPLDLGEDNWEVRTFGEERELISSFFSLIGELDPDILVAWNCPYDVNYLVNRARRLGLRPEELSPERKIAYADGRKVREIKGRALVDLLDLYRGRVRARSYTLEETAKREGVSLKIERGSISEMSPEEIARYNRRDVEIIRELDEKLSLIEAADELRRLVGLPWNAFFCFDRLYGRSIAGKSLGILTSRLVDTYMLRKARELGVVLPSKERREEGESYEGAYVIQPVPGVHKNVVVLDVKSMYPNIVRTYNISPETLDPEGEIRCPAGHRYRRRPRGLLPRIEDELFGLRLEYKRRMKEAEDMDERRVWDFKQGAVKVILNAFYGVMGYPGFRAYRREVAESVTSFGRELLLFIKSVVEEDSRVRGVIYGDTDSVFVRLAPGLSVEECVRVGEELAEKVNEAFPGFARRFGAEECFHEIEFEKVYSSILFLSKKKRYFGKVAFPEERYDVKGFEIVRTNVARVTSEVMEQVLKILVDLEGTRRAFEEARKVLSSWKERIRRGEVDIKDLVFKSSIDPGKRYVANTPQLRGLRNAKALGLVPKETFGQVFWLYVSGVKGSSPLGPGAWRIDVISLPPERVEEFSRFVIDYARCERAWFSPVERVIEELQREKWRSKTLFRFLQKGKKA